MTKILTLAIVVAAATAFATAAPAKKDKKQKKAECCTVALSSKSDSLSYTAGMTLTDGLMQYVGQKYGIDSTTIAPFVEGIREGLAKQGDKNFIAHAAGVEIAEMLETRMLPNVKAAMKETPWTVDSVKFNAGFVAAVLGDTAVMKTEAARNYYTSVLTAERKKKYEAYKKTNEEWLAENAKKEGVKTLPSGLQYKIIKQGTGEVAGKDDNVTVRYEGKDIEGNVFDSSYKRNPDTSTFRPDQVIKGWTEALTMMPEGSVWELYIPQDLAYGQRAAGKIKPFSTLIFKVELVKIDRKQEATANDAKDVKAAAKKTAAKKTVAKKKTTRK